MNLKMKTVVAIGSTVVLAGGVAGGAGAAGGRPAQDRPDTLKAQIVAGGPGVGHGPRQADLRAGLGLRGIIRAAADYLGLMPRDLLRQLRSGKSLADIATAQGKTVDGLETAILAKAKARLDRAVANGRISSAEEQQILDRLKTRLDTLVNRKFGHPSP